MHLQKCTSARQRREIVGKPEPEKKASVLQILLRKKLIKDCSARESSDELILFVKELPQRQVIIARRISSS